MKPMKPGDSVIVYNSRGRTWLSALGVVSNAMARRFIDNLAHNNRPYCIVRVKSLKNNVKTI